MSALPHIDRQRSSAYSTSGKPTSTTYPSGKQIQYSYAANGNLTGLNLTSNNSSGASSTNPLISGLTYDGSNRVAGWNFGNIGSYSAGSMTYAYNALDQLNRISHNQGSSALSTYTYSYLSNGNIKSHTTLQKIAGPNTAPSSIGSHTATYNYDATSQLTQEASTSTSSTISAAYSIGYSYDNNSNRTSVSASGANNPMDYTSASTPILTNKNRLSSYSTTQNGSTTHNVSYLSTGTGELRLDTLLGSAGYDSIGQRRYESTTPDGVYSSRWMEYNHKKERTLLWGGNSSTTVNGVTTTSTLTRQFMYDEASHLIGEYNRNGTPIVEYVWLGDKPIATIYPASSAYPNGRIIYLITDHANKPRRGYDPIAQRYVWSWDPTAFGVKLATAETGIVQNLRMAGQQYDIATGLHYNHNRFYNPKLGRYMEPDPIKLEGGNNPYAYVGNDPVNMVDPSGLDGFNFGDLSLPQDFSTGFAIVPAIPNIVSAGINLIGGLGIAAWDAIVPVAAPTDAPRHQKITVYRGTSNATENGAWEASNGIIMADATKNSFYQGDSLAQSLQNGIQRHTQLVSSFGGEYNLALAQSQTGTEFSMPPRSMFSVTTDMKVANYYAGSIGHVYSGSIDRRLLLQSPLNNKGGGESEYFIRVAYPMMRIR